MRYGILGPLEVRDGERTVPLAHGRQRVLLAVLLVHANEAISSDRLIDALWGEAPPPTAARSVHNLVSGLRKALGDGRLITEGRGYRLRVADDELDAARFDAVSAEGRAALAAGEPGRAGALLREALALWRGPAFGELAYEPAVQREAASLEERRLAAVEDRIDADLALGRHGELVAELRGLTTKYPLREEFWRQLMTALCRSERPAEALQVYGQVNAHLRDELGVDPGAELKNLHLRILRGEPVHAARG
jgi:DNA-binding SARP family transcriptional activator